MFHRSRHQTIQSNRRTASNTKESIWKVWCHWGPHSVTLHTEEDLVQVCLRRVDVRQWDYERLDMDPGVLQAVLHFLRLDPEP